jgi:nicotinamidase-related amidase
MWPEIKTIDDAAPELARADQKTLVVWDIDETLLEPEDPSSQCRFRDETQRIIHRLPFRKNIQTIIGSTKFFFEQPRHLVEPRTAELIKDLQKRAIPVIALSAFAGGPALPFCDDVHEHRHQELVRNGINFDQPLPVNSEALNADLHSLSQNNNVLLKRGILSTHPYNKGKILSLFIKHMTEQPNKGIVIDDNENCLFDVDDYLERLHITTSVYLYRAAYTKRKSDFMDTTITQKQFELIVKRNGYASYKEAETSLATQEHPYKKEYTLKPNYSFIAEPPPTARSSYLQDN